MQKTIHFERAIFISWYCSKRDCAFCYLSSRKHVNPDPIKDRRTISSILAEALICKACRWPVEFISGGCDSYTDEELLFIIKSIYEITGQKQWLNLGILNEKQLKLFKPYLAGVCGTVECITPKLRDRLCPSKPLDEIEDMFKLCDKLGIKKTITIILGLGEKLKDIEVLKKFIKKHNVDGITFYRLKPQKQTIFENAKPISRGYYVRWVKAIRDEFPKIKIITGSWLNHLDELHLLLEAGSDGITKFPSVRKFNSKYAKQIAEEVKKAGMKFGSNFTKVPKIDVDKLKFDDRLKSKIKINLDKYLKTMSKEKS